MDKRTLAEKSVASKRQREKDDEIQVSENQKRKMEKARWWLNDNIVDSEKQETLFIEKANVVF